MAVVGPAFAAAVGVGDGGEVAVRFVGVAGEVAFGVEHAGQAVERGGVGVAGGVAEGVGFAGEVAALVVGDRRGCVRRGR